MDFSGQRLVDADFSGRTFDGSVSFQRAEFVGDVSFAGARFTGPAGFGRARFRGRADFAGAEFADEAWFGRGTETWWEDDERWETGLVPPPWDEALDGPDPGWPVAVLVEDYQDWQEGGDGAVFAGDVTFAGARLAGPAWFYNARFGGAVSFAGAALGGRFHLDHPAADLTGAHWTGDGTAGTAVFPLGWTAPEAGGEVVRDPSADLRSERPELRQSIVTALCALLRSPSLTDEGRRDTQRLLVDRLRRWPGLIVNLCAATLVDLDLSGCSAEYADFSGAQFHGTTRFAGSAFKRASFSLGGPWGHATFLGEAVFDAEPPQDAVFRP
ncbi:pentapeptide repeat-containing protein [Dactylosporangium sp. CA-139114]|uniref:pentapeptide repeat-containing protein n=1 Tax=Dactylosporangium sp. CA-139114 TaxID=3239931 RepID=UPI003D97E474